MIKLSPEVAGYIPAIMGLLAAGLGYGAAWWTKRLAHPRKKDQPAE